MTKSQVPMLKNDEYIVTAYAEAASGPGWGNTPVWVVVCRKGTQDYRIECLQPDEQTSVMRSVYQVSDGMHHLMVKEARSVMTRKKGTD